MRVEMEVSDESPVSDSGELSFQTQKKRKNGWGWAGRHFGSSPGPSSIRELKSTQLDLLE